MLREWASVKEKLPEKTGNYLVTTEVINPYSGYKFTEIKTAFFTIGHWVVHEVEECLPGEVVAWKELDAPYGNTDVSHICKNCDKWFMNNNQTPLFYHTECPWRNNDVPMPTDYCSRWSEKR